MAGQGEEGRGQVKRVEFGQAGAVRGRARQDGRDREVGWSRWVRMGWVRVGRGGSRIVESQLSPLFHPAKLTFECRSL